MKFFQRVEKDFPECDGLIVMGTSLAVAPFSTLIRRVKKHVPRMLVNREAAGTDDDIPAFLALLMGTSGGFQFGKPGNTRDVFMQGDCDDSVAKLAELLSWTIPKAAL